MISRRQAQIR